MGIVILLISTICAVIGHIFVKKSEGMAKMNHTIFALISFLTAPLLEKVNYKMPALKCII